MSPKIHLVVSLPPLILYEKLFNINSKDLHKISFSLFILKKKEQRKRKRERKKNIKNLFLEQKKNKNI
jgi:hypothetical protein